MPVNLQLLAAAAVIRKILIPVTLSQLGFIYFLILYYILMVFLEFYMKLSVEIQRASFWIHRQDYEKEEVEEPFLDKDHNIFI